MKIQRFVSIFMALLLGMTCTVSCGQNDETDDTIPGETESVSETPEETDSGMLPDDLDLQGQTIRVLHNDGVWNIGINHEEITGELLNDTIFETNTSVMEDLNFKFQFIPLDASDVAPVEEAFVAGDDSYEIVLAKQNKLPPLMLQNMFADLDDSSESYINYDAPWWYENFISEARVHKDQTFFLAGDASMGVMNLASFLVINTDLMNILGKDMNALYETVLDGKWTLDAYKQLISDVYIDENGDTTKVYAHAIQSAAAASAQLVDDLLNPVKNRHNGQHNLNCEIVDKKNV